MKLINLADIESEKLDFEGAKNVFKQVPLGTKDGTPNFAFRVMTLKKDGHTPFHIHQSEHLNYVISGEGAIKKEDGKLEALKPGDFVFVKPHEKHQYLNQSDDDFVMICAVPNEFE